MNVQPRIYRTQPTGPVTTAAFPIPVLVTLRWMTGEPTEVLARAIAWTRTEVHVEWTFHGQARQDWITASDVRRQGTPPRHGDPATETPLRPPRADTRHPRRW
jgi:hypothetical protein